MLLADWHFMTASEHTVLRKSELFVERFIEQKLSLTIDFKTLNFFTLELIFVSKEL